MNDKDRIAYMMREWGYDRARAVAALEDGAAGDIGIERSELALQAMEESE